MSDIWPPIVAHRGNRILLIRTITALAVGILLLAGCGPKVSFTPNKNGDVVEFHFGLKNINGMIHLTVWEKDTRAILWDVNLDYYPGPVIKYGQVPINFTTFNGNRSSARQYIPANSEVPAPLPIGKEIWVHLTYQYDKAVPPAASGASAYFYFIINPDGSIKNLGQGFPKDGEPTFRR